MTTKEVDKGIKTILSFYLKNKGYKVSKGRFVLEEDDFSHIILYASLVGHKSRPTSFKFTVSSRVVGEIVQRSQGVEDNFEYRAIISHNQKKVFKLKPKEFPVESESDIINMCCSVKQYLEEEGFQFYKEYRNLRRVFNDMRRIELGEYYFNSNFMHWSLNYLAISRYLDDPNFNMCLEKFNHFVHSFAEIGHPFRDSFDRLVGFLIEHDSESLNELVNRS